MKERLAEKIPEEQSGTGEAIKVGNQESEGEDLECQLYSDIHDFIQENFADEAVHVSEERIGRLCALAEQLGCLVQPLERVLVDGEKDAQFRRAVSEILKERTVLEAALDKALVKLSCDGYMVAQRWGDCRSCGIGYLAKDAREMNIPPKGYVFYCEQDGEQMDKQGSVYVAFGVLDCYGSQQTKLARRVGEHAAEVFRWAGLLVDWDGSPEKTLFLKPCPC